MVNINLIDQSKSGVGYELTTFPDGEPHLKFTDGLNRKETYRVICRIANPNDLFVLMQVGDILNRQAVIFELDILYLMSMRMDRVVTFEEAFTLDVVAKMINSLNAEKVRIFHCHSERAFKLIDRSVDLEEDYGHVIYPEFDRPKLVCYPDHGAFDRYAKDLWETEFNKKGFCYSPIVMSKKRDLNDKGKIISLEIEKEGCYNPEVHSGIIVIDDLCDAGGTFGWAAAVLRDEYPGVELSIFVRHMVNPKGIETLSHNFNHVYITNSYKNWKNLPENVEVVDILDEFYK
jgi:ribose-phosphate pyrophosphokinase